MSEQDDPRRWDDEELIATFGDPSDVVFARDGLGGPAVVPQVLAGLASGAGAEQLGWAQQVAQLHSDDRGAAVLAWWQALQEPGELRTLEVRLCLLGGWRLVELSYVSLLHQPEVRAVLCRMRDRGPVESPQPSPRALVGERVAPARAVHELDAIGTVLRVNEMGEVLFGRPASELIGKSVLELVDPADHGAALAMWAELVAEPGSSRVMQMRYLRPDGSKVPVELVALNRLDDHRNGSVVIISHDISDRLAQEAALRASQEEFRSLAEEVPAAVFRSDHEGVVTFGNVRWFELVARRGPVTTLFELPAPDAVDELREAWARLVGEARDLSRPGDDTVRLEFPAADGERLLALHCRRVDSTDGPPTVVGVLSDVTDTAALRYRADHDGLTGLLNRQAVDRAVASALEQGGKGVVVVFVDLDRFKEVNDELGHAAGDAVLATLAQRLRECVRPDDVVGRYGGDEFVLVCRDLPTDGEPALLARIEEAFREPVAVGGAEWQVSASIGTARVSEGERAVDVIRRADAAMYQAKRGRHG